MRVHVSDPDLVPDLVRFLQQRVDTVVSAGRGDEVDVSILGSRHSDANRLELDLRLAVWRAAHPEVRLTLGE